MSEDPLRALIDLRDRIAHITVPRADAVTAADPDCFVQVTVDSSGAPTRVLILDGWLHARGRVDLRATVMEAYRAAIASQSAQWAGGVIDGSAGQISHRAPDLPVGDVRDPVMLVEDLLAASTALRRRRTAAAPPVENVGPVRFEFDAAGGMTSCRVDASWAASQSRQSVQAAVDAALALAHRQRESTTAPVRRVDELMGDVVTTFKALERDAGDRRSRS